MGSPGLVPLRFKAHKSFLFTEKFPCIKNKEQLVDFVIILYSDITLLYAVAKCKQLRMRRSIVIQVVGISKKICCQNW